MLWLLEQNTLQELRRCKDKADANAFSKVETRADDYANIYQVSGSNAVIDIQGVLTMKRDWLFEFFGMANTSYEEIIGALAAAEFDQSVTDITLNINSPGGEAYGMFEAIAALQKTTKPITAVGRGAVASAAYGIASQADRILSANKATRFGSVGVVATLSVNENYVEITSSNAPRKRPDVTTEEGAAMVRDEIDAVEALFIEAIATGRKVSEDQVKSNYGRGGMLISSAAIENGMVDEFVTESGNRATTNTANPSGGQSKEVLPMDLKELKAQHPALYAEAAEIGAKEERDRVDAHLTLGKASGDMATALSAIADGSGVTAGIQAKHMAAAMNKRDKADATGDDNAIEGAANPGAHGKENLEGTDAAEDVTKAVEALLGIDGEA